MLFSLEVAIIVTVAKNANVLSSLLGHSAAHFEYF
jgi:hypothetical protein